MSEDTGIYRTPIPLTGPDCYFTGMKENTVRLYVSDIVYDVLRKRELTQKDEEAIRTAVDATIQMAILNHYNICADKRGRSGHVAFTVILSVMSLLIALASLASKFMG